MSAAPFDTRALRDAFGTFITGVTVVTTRDGGGRPIGFTANSFSSVSLDPPLFLVCLARTSRNFAAMTEAPGFAVNILSEGQREVSNTFARPVEDRFAGVDWRDGPAGSPVFAAAAAWFDCRTERVVEAGDHVVLIGRVEAFENSGLNGLGYARGSYFCPALDAEAARARTGETIAGAVLERDGAVLLMEEAGERWSLPRLPVGQADATEALQRHIEEATRLPVSIGFLFSVFDDRAHHRRHVVHRASIAAGEPAAGRFFPVEALPFDRLDSPQTADILRRFVTESAIGDYGVYVGDETAGQVHPIAKGTAPR